MTKLATFVAAVLTRTPSSQGPLPLALLALTAVWLAKRRQRT